jgi:effector-binding domain-containing protein
MFEAKIEHVEPMWVAFVEMRGAYAQVPQALGTLYAWVGAHGLIPAGMPRAVYFTDPASTPEADAIWEVQTAVIGQPAAQPADAQGAGVKLLEAADQAVTVHRGPYETLGDVYTSLGGWVTDNGYELAGAPLEAYLSDPATTAPADYLTEVRFPVRHRGDE